MADQVVDVVSLAQEIDKARKPEWRPNEKELMERQTAALESIAGSLRSTKDIPDEQPPEAQPKG